MSGIYGCILGHIEKKLSSEDIEKLHVWNMPYGDDDYQYIHDNIAFGCCVNKHTKCPKPLNGILENDDKMAVMDAVIYNREELCEKLENTKAISDEELLFKYIGMKGIDALAEVNGDFCGAIYDKKCNNLLLFRDHMGVRPLFLYKGKDVIAFSTDIRGLIAFPYTDLAINEEWLYRIIFDNDIGLNKTEFLHIRPIKHASYIKIDLSSDEYVEYIHDYWTFSASGIKLKTFDAYKTKLKELITDAVERRLNVVEGRVGAELSGGLDSGVVDLIIADTKRECLYHSWSEDPEILPYADGDERFIIEDLCKMARISCHYSDKYIFFGNDTRMGDNLKQTGIRLDESERPDEYCVFPQYVNTLEVYATAAYMRDNGVYVVFSGHGGDEGVSHRAKAYELFYNKEYLAFFRQMYKLIGNKNLKILRTIKYCFKYVLADSKKYTEGYTIKSDDSVLKKEFCDKFSGTKVNGNSFFYNVKDYISEGYTGVRLDVAALLGAFGGVRYVFPFLDYRVIDYAASIPRYLYLNGKADRYIFREAFKDMMPRSLYELEEKSDNSRSNFVKKELSESDKNDAIYYEKQFFKEKIDWQYWSKYLSEELIDCIEACKKPESEEERLHDKLFLDALRVCYRHQNLIVKLRGSMIKLL